MPTGRWSKSAEAMQTAWGSGSSSGRSASWARSSRTLWTSPPEWSITWPASWGSKTPPCLRSYAGRGKTRLEHQWEIARLQGYRDFASAEADLSTWIGDRAWTTGEGPRALFGGAVGWLRERRVLLPGVSVLTRLVAGVREATTQRLWDTLAAKVGPGQARLLDGLLEVPSGARLSDLERLRHGPTSVSGRA